jgi:hypothetical protein
LPKTDREDLQTEAQKKRKEKETFFQKFNSPKKLSFETRLKKNVKCKNLQKLFFSD